MGQDVHDLERFVRAQEGGVYERALAEVKAGRKTGHWMWFVFPQLTGLGRSPTAQAYAIGSLEEAAAYLADPVLGPRLRTCADALLEGGADDAQEIFGTLDAWKLRSSMTLFAEVPEADPVFAAVLARFFAGARDERTRELLDLAAR